MYRCRRAIHRKLVKHPLVKAAVIDRLREGWSPEQIAGRMEHEHHLFVSATKRSTAIPIQRMAAARNSIVTCPSIAATIGRAAGASRMG
jgi:IS30 family transposase